MAKHSKRYREIANGNGDGEALSLDEAIAAVKRSATAKFDESIDVAVRLGVDPRKGDQQVRGVISLPHGTGRPVRVAVFAEGEAAQEAREAGADEVGGQDLIAKIDGGWSEFDVLVATRDMMRNVARLGKKLGPRMPNNKAGTVGDDVGAIVKELKAGRIEYRLDRFGNVHAVIGRASFEPQALRENLLALIDALLKGRPAAAKGQYLRSIAVSPTMGPAVRVDAASVQAALRA